MVEQSPPLTDETRYRLLTYLAAHPEASQRDLARELDVSVGKINYCLRSLIDKGLLKIRNFRRNMNKLSYAYVLTPKGIEEKINVTYRFLRRKIEEYDALSAEIEHLRQEVEKGASETQSRAGT
jgi:EPS-associated MarR family transcriptional regulator